MDEAQWRYAVEADEEQVLALMRQYYAEDGYEFHEDRARGALARLFTERSLGRIWVVSTENEVVGYVVLTLGFSLEYLGRDAFVDELYIAPGWRGKGLGSAALERVEKACGALEVNALHLEVETGKEAARGLYENVGFERHERHLMTKWLNPPIGVVLDLSELDELARRYAQAWCGHDPASVAAFYSEVGSLSVNGGAPAVGRGAIANLAQGFMDAFPDMVVTYDRLESRESGVAFHWTLMGTNTGHGGSGKRVRISGYEVWRIGDDGLIAESKGNFDADEYERQLAEGIAADV